MSADDDMPSVAQVQAAESGRALTALYEAKGLSAATAHTVAVELSARGALAGCPSRRRTAH